LPPSTFSTKTGEKCPHFQKLTEVCVRRLMVRPSLRLVNELRLATRASISIPQEGDLYLAKIG
jgi:hypothetical protein